MRGETAMPLQLFNLRQKQAKKKKNFENITAVNAQESLFFFIPLTFFRKQASRTVCVGSTVLIAFHLKGK